MAQTIAMSYYYHDLENENDIDKDKDKDKADASAASRPASPRTTALAPPLHSSPHGDDRSPACAAPPLLPSASSLKSSSCLPPRPLTRSLPPTGGQQAMPSPSSSSCPQVAKRSHRRVKSLPSASAMFGRTSGVAAAETSGAVANDSAGSGEALRGEDLLDLTTNLNEQTRRYGDGHPKVGLAHNLIGNYHFRRGDHELAARHYDDALRCFESSSLSSLSSLSCSVKHSWDDVVSLAPSSCSCSSSGSLGDASDASSACAGTGHGEGAGGGQVAAAAAELRHELDVAVALGNIGAVLWSTGKLSEAIETLEKSVAIRRRVHDQRRTAPSDKDIAELSNALYSLGLARSLRGDYDDALESLNRARDVLTDSNSSSSSAFVEFARIEDARGKVHLMRGDADSALECHLRAIHSKLSSGVLHPSHPSVLATRTNVAAARKALGQYDEAESVLKDVLSAQKYALYRERDPNTRRKLGSDVEMTVKTLGEVQRERAKMGRRRTWSRGGSIGLMSGEIMAAIME